MVSGRIGKPIPAKTKLYHHYQNVCAKPRGLEFTLTIEEFLELIDGDCFYCDSPPSNEFGKNNKYLTGSHIYNGIDRLDNNKGYTLTNCVPCCKICNKMKSNLGYDEFFSHIKKIYNRRIKDIL